MALGLLSRYVVLWVPLADPIFTSGLADSRLGAHLQTVEFMIERIRKGSFYILCPGRSTLPRAKADGQGARASCAQERVNAYARVVSACLPYPTIR